MEDWPTDVFTIVCWDMPGYGKSLPLDRMQEPARAKKDASLAIKLMQVDRIFAKNTQNLDMNKDKVIVLAPFWNILKICSI